MLPLSVPSGVMACTLDVPMIGDKDECFMISPTSLLTSRRRKIRASRLAFGKHITKVEEKDFGALTKTLHDYLEESKKSMKGGLCLILCILGISL